MPIGNISKDSGPRRESFRPPWVKEKDVEQPPSWMQKKLKPVESITKTASVDEPAAAVTPAKPLKPALKKQATIKDKAENGVSAPVEEKLVKPSSAKQADQATKPADEKPRFTKSALKSALKSEDKSNDKTDKPPLRSVRTIDDKVKEKSVTIVDKRPEKNGPIKANSTVNDKVDSRNTVSSKDTKPATKVLNDKPASKTSAVKSAPKAPEKIVLKPVEDIEIKPIEKLATKPAPTKAEQKPTAKAEVKPLAAPKAEPKPTGAEKVETKPTSAAKVETKPSAAAKVETKPSAAPKADTKPSAAPKAEPKPSAAAKAEPKPTATEKAVEKSESTEMATKPPTSKLPPRKPPIQKQPSKDDVPVKKWRDPLHERVKENIDKTLNEVPKGHTLTKNESLRSLLKPTPPPMPPPLPPKMPPPPEFKKVPVDPEKLKRLEQLRSRPRRRPDWTDMMKEVEEGKKLKHVVCNDRSSPIITTSTVVKNKDQFIFESEKPNSHNNLLKEINKGIKLKKTKTNDRSKPNLEGLRKFRRQMTIEEQVQKSMSQANLAASPSGVGLASTGGAEASSSHIPGMIPPEDEEVDDMDDIDKVRDDLQSTKQLLAIELRNKEAQERENKRLLTRIANLEAELARERAFIKQEQHKTVISVTDAYDERLVNSLKSEVEKTKQNADHLEKQYLDAAEDRDTALTELEEVKRRNAELERKLEQAMSGIMPTSMGSRRSSHAIKQLSVTKDDSFEEEEESDDEEEESEEKKQKRMEKEVRNTRNKIRYLKEKQDHMKRERMGFKMSLKNQQAALKEEKRKYKELKREVDKMAAMMKECGSDDEDDEDEEESEEEKKSESEEEESETETEQDTESETESESEPEDAPLPKKKENLTTRMKRHETRVNALRKGNALLMANVDRLKDDVLKQREESSGLKKELDSLIDDLE